MFLRETELLGLIFMLILVFHQMPKFSCFLLTAYRMILKLKGAINDVLDR